MNHLYLQPDALFYGDHRIPLDHSDGTPPAELVIKACGQLDLGGKLRVLLRDDLLQPLRIDLDQKPNAKELDHFLRWKLKRFLPYPPDQGVLRSLPLQTPNAYVTLTLHQPWLNALHAALKDKGAQAGYIGGLFVTLLEEFSVGHGAQTIALFDDFYMLAERDVRGGYQRVRTRRLPFDAHGALDVAILAREDLAPLIQAGEQPAKLLVLSPAQDRASSQIVQDLARHDVPIERIQPDGATPLQRFETCMKGAL